ncbi:MAG: hypothetical protein MK102_04840 [Fuerstiella sp.]|nr:hypothetical protein [Fuerstiella sp.]
MLHVTESAWKRLSKLQATRPTVSVLRLNHENGKVKCSKGICKPRDQVIERSGRPKLLLTPTVARELSDQTLHAPRTQRSRRL